MIEPQLQVYPNVDALSRAAAKRFAALALEAVTARGRFTVALSGGGTPEGLYQRLARHPFRDQLPWAQTHFFWGDERSVPPTGPESNFYQAQVALLSHIAVPAKNLHRIKGEWEPRAAADDYAAQLCQYASSNLAWPRFDLILLGLGRDGHTASLFPGPIDSGDPYPSPVLAVTADYQGRPARRVTLTPLVLNSARHVFFLVAGADKAAALNATLAGPLEPERWPAQQITPEQGTVTWFVDESAASLLQSTPDNGLKRMSWRECY